MAFEEIKAKLGLDVTDFERGAAKAQGSLKSVIGDATKKFTDFKQIGQTLATALGLNIQNIADGIARFVTGMSKEVEDSLKGMVDASNRSVDEVNKTISKRRSAMGVDAELKANREAQAQAQKKLDNLKATQAIQEKSSSFWPADVAAREETNKQIAETSTTIQKLYNEETDLVDKIDKKKQDSADKITSAKESLAKTERDIVFSQIDDAAKVEYLEQEINDALKDRINAQADSEEYYAAEQKYLEKHEEKRQLQVKIENDINKTAQDAADKEKAKTAELEKQTGELRKQIKVKQDDINNSRRQAELPTMADVISGKRNIGGVARGRATQLERDRAKVLELSDSEQRAREALSSASGFFAQSDAMKSGRAIRGELDRVRANIISQENLLGSRISNANPNAAMEKELMNIKTELKILNNTTLAPTTTK
jgi:hypothetical protein